MELSKIPAFGLENKKWAAFSTYNKKAKEIIEKELEKELDANDVAKKVRLMTNILKILEYIPFVGILFGILGLVSLIDKKERQESSIHFVERHAIAAVGLGMLLPIADMIATVVRNRQAKKAASCLASSTALPVV